MDMTFVLICFGFILCGVIFASPIAYLCGYSSGCRAGDDDSYAEEDDVLSAEVIQ